MDSAEPSKVRGSEQQLLDTLVGQPLREVRLDLAHSRIELSGPAGGVRLGGIVSATLLGPWDGASARVESLRIVHDDGERRAIELRLQYPEVPRTYRIVARSIEAIEPG